MPPIPLPKFLRNGIALALIGWTLLNLGSTCFFLQREWRQTLENGRNLGRGVIQKDFAYRLWNAAHGGVYVPVDPNTLPNPYLSHVKERDITTPSGTLLTKINPAYMTRQVHKFGEKEYGIKGHITSLKLMRPENQADQWESRVLKDFAQHPNLKEFSELTAMDEQEPFMRIMVPLKIRKECLTCHAYQAYKIGDLRGGISASIPMRKLIAQTRQAMFLLCTYHTMIFLLGVLALAFFYVAGRRRITELDQANRLVSQNEEMLQGIIDNTESAIAIYESNLDGSKFFCKSLNPAGEKITGLKTSEIRGREVREIFPAIAEMGLFAVLQRVWRSGQPEFLPLSRYNDERLSLWVENKVFKLPGGEIVAVVDDLTLKKEAETELNQSQQRWQKTFDAIPDIITLLDPELRVVQANRAACKLFRDNGELIGKHCYELFSATAEPCSTCPSLKIFTDNHNHTEVIEHCNLGKTFLVSITPIFDEKGALSHLIHSARDISERVKLNEELCQTRKMEAIGTLAGGVAHDFNNILTVIRGHAELAMMQSDEKNQFWNDFEAIAGAADRASLLTRQLLAFSRKEKINPEIIQVAPLITNLGKMLKRLIGEDVELDLKLDNHLPPILADRVQIEQIIINLIVNAADATRDVPLQTGRKITLSASPGSVNSESRENAEAAEGVAGPPALWLEISDNGCGIPENLLSKIFDPFFTTKERGKGTGLGLSTVHGIVKQNQAQIRVTSQPGRGSTFTIIWPGSESCGHTRKEQRPENAVGGSETILIAEDDQATRDMTAKALRHAGYYVLEAGNGEEAVALAQNRDTIDLLFSDLVMPRMGGLELAAELRRFFPEIRIILTSGYLSERASILDGETLEQTTFIDKPYQMAGLLRTIREILDRN
ncbi:MAG: DUF3365 domain-containing protein [Deltaproteobacteria bacterium]|nr:DUF3365 domain-containing protein [Deltaproteobacteria bacterium]